jgi:hypothetical protein
MVDGFHIHIRNRMMKPLAITEGGAGRGWEESVGDDLTNIQYKTI